MAHRAVHPHREGVAREPRQHQQLVARGRLAAEPDRARPLEDLVEGNRGRRLRPGAGLQRERNVPGPGACNQRAKAAKAT